MSRTLGYSFTHNECCSRDDFAVRNSYVRAHITTESKLLLSACDKVSLGRLMLKETPSDDSVYDSKKIERRLLTYLLVVDHVGNYTSSFTAKRCDVRCAHSMP